MLFPKYPIYVLYFLWKMSHILWIGHFKNDHITEYKREEKVALLWQAIIKNIYMNEISIFPNGKTPEGSLPYHRKGKKELSSFLSICGIFISIKWILKKNLYFLFILLKIREGGIHLP